MLYRTASESSGWSTDSSDTVHPDTVQPGQALAFSLALPKLDATLMLHLQRLIDSRLIFVCRPAHQRNYSVDSQYSSASQDDVLDAIFPTTFSSPFRTANTASSSEASPNPASAEEAREVKTRRADLKAPVLIPVVAKELSSRATPYSSKAGTMKGADVISYPGRVSRFAYA